MPEYGELLQDLEHRGPLPRVWMPHAGDKVRQQRFLEAVGEWRALPADNGAFKMAVERGGHVVKGHTRPMEV